jgi:nucleoside-diphosphate-sugar epimerase
MPLTVLLGATGALGRTLARLLSERESPFRAVSRFDMALKARLDLPHAEPFVWDPKETPASVARALAGADTAVYLVGAALWEFAEHLALTRAALAAARETGLRRLLLVSQTWAYGPPQPAYLRDGRIPESHPLAPATELGRVRAEQEKLVLAAHTPGGLQTAVLRSGEFYGPWVEASALWSPLRAARSTALGKPAVAQLLAPIDLPRDWVYIPDAARTLLQMLDSEQVWGRAWNLAGPETATTRSMAELIFREAGVPKPRYATPSPWRLSMVRMVNPYIRALEPMGYLLQTPPLLDDQALGEALGGLAKTPFPEAVRQTLPTVRVGR